MSTDYIKVYKRNTEKAGCFYTNIVRKVISVLGAEGTYQQGNSNGQKVHYWFINEDIDSSGLPDVRTASTSVDLVGLGTSLSDS